MARTRYTIKTSSFSSRNGGKNNLTTLVICMLVGVFVLIPIFGLFGLIWCAVLAKPLISALKDKGIVKKDVEGKYNVDWNKAKSYGKDTAGQFRTYSQDTAKKYKVHISESDNMEERKPYQHSHTPVSYSYDSCAQERRLEQIKSLKEAGLLDEAEYQQRKRDIMAGR